MILNADVEGVGFAGELVTVKAGFARNFLLLKQQADVATPAMVKQREADIAKAEKRRTDEVAKLQETADKLSATPVKLSLKVGPDNRTFGSVTATEVAKQAAEQLKADLSAQQLSGLPLKALGRHTVSAKLGLGVVAQLQLDIKAESAKAPKAKAETTA